MTPSYPIPLILDNSATILDDSGWALIAPFGEHPKTRVYRDQTSSGRNIIREQKYVQVLDHAAADALVARENSLFRTLKRALIGIPIYKGHGDLADHDSKAISSDREKIKLGVVERIRKTARGIEARFALDPDGAAAVAAGWKLPSAFWWVQPVDDRRPPLGNGNSGSDVIRCRPFKLISVALTQFPNISGVESLANSGRRDPDPAGTAGDDRHRRAIPTTISGAVVPASAVTETSRGQETTTPHTEPDMKLIAGWLIGQGAALANAESPTETQVLEAIKTVLTAKAGEVTALGNENSTLAGQLAALANEHDALKHCADEATTALANEQTARKAERRSRAAMHVDDNEGNLNAIWCDEPLPRATSENDFYYDGDIIDSSIYTTAVSYNEVGWFNIKRAKAGLAGSPANANELEFFGSGKWYLNLQKVDTAKNTSSTVFMTPANGTSNALVWIDAEKFTASGGAAWFNQQIGTLWARVSHLEDIGGAAPSLFTGNAEAHIDGLTATMGTRKMFTRVGTFGQPVEFKNFSMTDTNGECIYLQTNGISFSNVKMITFSNAPCIGASSPQSISYLGGSVTNIWTNSVTVTGFLETNGAFYSH